MQNQRILPETKALIEFQTNVCLNVKNQQPDYLQFDLAWAKKVQSQMMEWLKEGKIIVLENPPKIIENAMAQVESAFRNANRLLRSWDALHVSHASHWARSLNQKVTLMTTEKVTIVTNDSDIHMFLGAFPDFNVFIDIFDPADGFVP